MPKLFFISALFLLFYNCSFDNKTGIWENDGTIKKKNNVFNDFKYISSSQNIFNKEVEAYKNFNFFTSKPEINKSWKDIFYNKENNFKNFSFKEYNKLIYKSSKLTRHPINENILYEKDNLIFNDKKGNIFVFSIPLNKLITKFNFYKKKFKDFEKNLNLIVDDNIIYVSDNLGYLYSLDYLNNKILWAQDYKIPFRSNLKISANKLIASNQDNTIFFFDKRNGAIQKKIPTEETVTKNKFINNLSINKNDMLSFLNSFGSLYSIDIKNMNINWFINLNNTFELNPSNLFLASQTVNDKNLTLVSTDKNFFIIDNQTGTILKKHNISSIVRPIVHNNIAYIVTTNNLLISINLDQKEILFSYSLKKQSPNLFKQKIKIKNFVILNNKIKIFLNNSYILSYKLDGQFDRYFKLSQKINSNPIFINESVLYINKKNKLNIIN